MIWWGVHVYLLVGCLLALNALVGWSRNPEAQRRMSAPMVAFVTVVSWPLALRGPR